MEKEKKKFKLYQKWWFWVIISLFIFIIIFFITNYKILYIKSRLYTITTNADVTTLSNNSIEISVYLNNMNETNNDVAENIGSLLGEIKNYNWYDYGYINFYVDNYGILTSVECNMSTGETRDQIWAKDIDDTDKEKDSIEKSPNTNISTDSSTNQQSNTTQNNNINNTLNSSSVTLGQKNALSKAKSYLEYMAFSYSGLIEQLEYEGFSNDEAKYGADNCGADWNEQAAKKAQSYMNTMSFSKNSLIEQLEYEGFTSSQAEYGAQAVGY